MAARDPMEERLHAATGFVLVLLLSALAGMTDAIGFIAAGDFISFMSGNTTRFAIAIGEGDLSDIARLSTIIGLFVAGNALGVVVVRRTGDRHWPLLLIISGLLATSASTVGESHSILTLLPSILAMGMLNSAVEIVAGHPINLTYVTGALARFGKGIGRLLTGERNFSFVIQIVPWLGMLGGAVAGTLLQMQTSTLALFVAASLAFVLAIATLAIPASWRAAYLGRNG